MNKPRLFVFGDSFVDWDVPKYHWTYYLTYHYDVQKFGKLGADNYSIVFQLGNLPEYQDGDRLIIFFTEPGRLPRRFYGERKRMFANTPYIAPGFFKDVEFSKKLHELKYEEGNRWANNERSIEVEFLKNLKKWLVNYRPIFLTWSNLFHSTTSDFVTLVAVSSNFSEGVSEERDFHPGPAGCYDIYSMLYNMMDIKEVKADFKQHKKSFL